MVITAMITVAAVTAPSLPAPTGEHAVGRTALTVSDPSRAEPFTDEPADHRVLGVDLWYPADPSISGRVERYLDDETAAAFAEDDAEAGVGRCVVGELARVGHQSSLLVTQQRRHHDTGVGDQLDAGAAQRLGDGQAAELGRAESGQAALELADGGARGAGEVDR